MRIRRLRVDSARNSMCGSISFRHLDWSDWFTDDSFKSHYLHVAGPHGTYHRVRCRDAERPRLSMAKGHLYWLVDEQR